MVVGVVVVGVVVVGVVVVGVVVVGDVVVGVGLGLGWWLSDLLRPVRLRAFAKSRRCWCRRWAGVRAIGGTGVVRGTSSLALLSCSSRSLLSSSRA